jgi:PAS domain S-box-containing protein
VSEPTKSAFIDVLDDPFFTFDDTGEVIDSNRAALVTTGYNEEEITGMSLANFFESREAETDLTALTSKSVLEGELVTATDERIPYEFTFHPLPDQTDTAVGAIGRDITLRYRQREIIETREEILHEMYDIISDQRLSFAEQVHSLLKLGREELGTAYGTLSRIEGTEYIFEVVDTDDDSIQAGDTAPVSATNCEIAASTRETLVLGDVERDAPEETDRAGYTEWGIACYIGAPVVIDEDVYGTFCFYDTAPRDGQFSSWEVTLVDFMSRWVSYELQREQTKEQLQRQNDRLEKFASIVSHDLRNPLDVATTRLELAADDCDSEHLEPIQCAHERMENLIADILTLAQQDGQVTETESVALEILVEQCWSNVDTKQATMTIETKLRIRAKKSRLQQLFENLIRNAVEHGGEAVTIRIGSLDNGFYFEDDGPGIPDDEREQIFEVGYTTMEGGTGFGLNIVQEIVAAHGWEVRATEGCDGGARFEITGVDTTEA